MHGGKGSGAPRGNRNAWKHGIHSARVREIARYLRAVGPAAMARILSDAGLGKEKYKKRADNPMHPEIAARSGPDIPASPAGELPPDLVVPDLIRDPAVFGRADKQAVEREKKRDPGSGPG